MGINITIFTGFVGGFPTTFKFGEGKEGLRFNFAISNKVKDEFKTTWFQVTLFGFQVEKLKDDLMKGDMVLVHGKVGSSDYTAKDGNEKTSFTITATSVEVLKKKVDKDVQKEPKQEEFKDDDINF